MYSYLIHTSFILYDLENPIRRNIMKYTKTITSVIFSALLLLGMAGCSSDNAPIVDLPIADLPLTDSAVTVSDKVSS